MVSAITPSRGGRNARQSAQSAATRNRLIVAGTSVLAAKGFAATVVADVLDAARVSRATFYSHFDSMIALVAGIADDFVPVWQPIYRQLARLLDRDLAALRGWCERMVAVYRNHEAVCVILAQATMFDTGFYWKIAQYQSMLIDLLADGDRRLAHLRHDKAARMRAALALTQLDQACYFLAVRRWDDDVAAGIDVMAAQLHFFLHSEMGQDSAGSSRSAAR